MSESGLIPVAVFAAVYAGMALGRIPGLAVGRTGVALLGLIVLLAVLVAVAGGLSTVLTNDVTAFALTPLLCAGLRARGLDPKPYLVALAGAANAGSAATLIGNPQNILIGQIGGLGFWRYSLHAVPITLAALISVYAVVLWVWADSLRRAASPSSPPRPSSSPTASATCRPSSSS